MPCRSGGHHRLGSSEPKEAEVLEETHDNDQIIEHVAALDVGKAELTCCVRVPGLGKSGKRLQEVRTDQTMTRWLLGLADRLGELGVTRVVMEATSDLLEGVFYLLEAHGFQRWLVNARDARAPPGTAQDRHPGCGLAVQARRAATAAAQLRPPRPIRQLREVTRYRADLVAAPTAEKQRVDKLPGGRPEQAERGRQRQLPGCPGGPCSPR
jgi:transposase